MLAQLLFMMSLRFSPLSGIARWVLGLDSTGRRLPGTFPYSSFSLIQTVDTVLASVFLCCAGTVRCLSCLRRTGNLSLLEDERSKMLPCSEFLAYSGCTSLRQSTEPFLSNFTHFLCVRRPQMLRSLFVA